VTLRWAISLSGLCCRVTLPFQESCAFHSLLRPWPAGSMQNLGVSEMLQTYTKTTALGLPLYGPDDLLSTSASSRFSPHMGKFDFLILLLKHSGCLALPVGS
jgi:hypothetical protein